MMKESMKMAMLQFCARIMVKKYEKKFYLPAAERFARLTADNAKEAVILSAQYNRLSSLWGKIRIEHPVRKAEGPFWVGERFEVTAMVNLGELRPDEVKMELYYGPLKTVDSIADSHSQEMTVKEVHGDSNYLYSCTIACSNSGRYGFTVRAIPNGDDRIRFAPGLITWA
jgi:starch phosphorylase